MSVRARVHFELLVWFSSKVPGILGNGTLRMGIFVAMEKDFVPRSEGPWFLECPYATFRFHSVHLYLAALGTNVKFLGVMMNSAYMAC